MTISLSFSPSLAPNPDILLISGGEEKSVEFPVHRCVLSAASPFFADMFSLPQPEDSKFKLPTINMSEGSATIEALLQLVYPVPDPVFDNLNDLGRVLDSAFKYDLIGVIDTLRHQLVQPHFLVSNPTQVYAIACRYELTEEAKLASRYTLDINILDAPLNDDLKHINAYSYHQLLDLHRRRSQAAIELLKCPENIKCAQCNGSAFSVIGSPRWWNEFERRAREELLVRPTTGSIFELKFLAKVANGTSCQYCASSVLDSWMFLQSLKAQIDALPSTI